MKKDQVYLFHIQDAIERVEDYCKKGKADFMANRKTQDAVIRNLEIVGEACKNISDNFKNKYPKFPWRNLSGLRDKLIHHYFGVSLSIVWQVIEKNLPELKISLKELINKKS